MNSFKEGNQVSWIGNQGNRKNRTLIGTVNKNSKNENIKVAVRNYKAINGNPLKTTNEVIHITKTKLKKNQNKRSNLLQTTENMQLNEQYFAPLNVSIPKNLVGNRLSTPVQNGPRYNMNGSPVNAKNNHHTARSKQQINSSNNWYAQTQAKPKEEETMVKRRIREMGLRGGDPLNENKPLSGYQGTKWPAVQTGSLKKNGPPNAKNNHHTARSIQQINSGNAWLAEKRAAMAAKNAERAAMKQKKNISYPPPPSIPPPPPPAPKRNNINEPLPPTPDPRRNNIHVPPPPAPAPRRNNIHVPPPPPPPAPRKNNIHVPPPPPPPPINGPHFSLPRRTSTTYSNNNNEYYNTYQNPPPPPPPPINGPHYSLPRKTQTTYNENNFNDKYNNGFIYGRNEKLKNLNTNTKNSKNINNYLQGYGSYLYPNEYNTKKTGEYFNKGLSDAINDQERHGTSYVEGFIDGYSKYYETSPSTPQKRISYNYNNNNGPPLAFVQHH